MDEFNESMARLECGYNPVTSDIDELIFDLICGYELVGEIEGLPAGILNVKEDYATFFVGHKDNRIRMDIPEEDFGPDTVLYKGKTLRELLEEGIIYNAVMF